MPSTSFFAVDPAGATHKRTSLHRIYTHTVVALPNAAKHVLNAKHQGDRAVVLRNFAYYEALAAGTSQHLARRSYENEIQHLEHVNRETTQALAELDGCGTAEEYVDMLVERALASIQKRREAGYYDTYQNMGWCGRPDLAAKRKVTCENYGYLLAVTILPAQVRA